MENLAQLTQKIRDLFKALDRINMIFRITKIRH